MYIGILEKIQRFIRFICFKNIIIINQDNPIIKC